MNKNSIEVKKVSKGKLLRQFINLPRVLNINDPLWVPQISLFERLDYIHGKNAVLARSEHLLLLAREGGRPAGRLIAYIDPRYNDHYGASMGFFGAFESVNNPAVSEALFKTAESWFKNHGITDVRGPIDPVAECWGFLLEGESSPVFMSPHNPVYYNSLVEKCGYDGVKKLFVYEADGGEDYILPERLSSFSDRLLRQKKNISVRRIVPSKIETEAEHILNILNTAVSGNWGYVPVGSDEMKDLTAKLKLIIDKDAIWFVEDNGVPVGCALGYPDINILVKQIDGRLFPFGFIKFLRGRKKLKDYRLWGLAVLPEYQGQGLDVLLYVSLYRALKPKGIRLEANYVLEDNLRIINALEKLKLERIKSYRVYEKTL